MLMELIKDPFYSLDNLFALKYIDSKINNKFEIDFEYWNIR